MVRLPTAALALPSVFDFTASKPGLVEGDTMLLWLGSETAGLVIFPSLLSVCL
jgi:hypothetical protein